MRYLIALLLTATLAGNVSAQYSGARRTQLIDSNTARRFGLEPMWSAQLKMDASTGGLSGGVLQVSSTEGTSIFEVVEGAKPAADNTPADPGVVLEVVTNEHVNPFGEKLGKEGAEKKAVLRVAELKKAGRDVSIRSHDVPDIIYVASSDRGMVQAWDAETGETRWARLVGRTTYPTTPPAVNDEYVAVVNGVHLYVLNRDDGKIVFDKELKGVSVAAPALSKNHVFALSTSGMMQSYRLDEPKDTPVRYQSHGKALISPVMTPNSIVWPTDEGHFYVGSAITGGINYRIETDRTAVAPAGYLAPYYLYMVATDGYVYCVHERSGNVVWSYPLAEEVTKMPVAIGRSVYVATDQDKLYSMDAASGTIRWWQPGISKFVSRSGPYLYCLDSLGRLVTLDGRSGGRIQTMPEFGLDYIQANAQTDRILLATKQGRIQCLRTMGKTYPEIHIGGAEETGDSGAKPAAPPAAPPPAGGVPDPFAPPAAGGAPADPFAPPGGGGGAAPDPFAPPGGAAPGGAAPDPFAPPAGGAPGGAAPDPFAPPGGGAAAPDPFAPAAGGAAPDPFAP